MADKSFLPIGAAGAALQDDEVTGKVERSDRTSARKMYAMRECMLKHDIG